MAEASARFALPLLVPGQAQKELYHNEALTVIDATLHASAEAGPQTEPPAAPAPGQSWIVAAGAIGSWSGQEGALASWTAGGWRFVPPREGMMVWNKAVGCWLHWTGTGWSDGYLPATALRIDGQQVVGNRQPAVPNPSGGTIIDAEGRAAIAAVIATLKSHGLIE